AVVTRLLRDWGPALLWTAILFGLSSRPTLPVDLGGGLDKLAHFGAYALLGLLLAHGQARSGIALLWAVAAGMLIGALDEFYQGFAPGRATELADWAADTLGVLTGVSLYHLGLGWWRSRSTPAPGAP
ncbi:MAG TPA: VanZ family protein, partial [Longimicrobiaceae bacterium]|nr:VanZ family protein [Longimicrobiaceae bacterium]